LSLTSSNNSKKKGNNTMCYGYNKKKHKKDMPHLEEINWISGAERGRK